MTTIAMNIHIEGAYAQIGNCNYFIFLANARTVAFSEFAILNPVNFNPIDVKGILLTGV